MECAGKIKKTGYVLTTREIKFLFFCDHGEWQEKEEEEEEEEEEEMGGGALPCAE